MKYCAEVLIVFLFTLLVVTTFSMSSSRVEWLSSGSVGLDGSTRLAAGGIAGPLTWAPALLQQRTARRSQRNSFAEVVE